MAIIIAVNVLLRFVTKDRLVLFALLCVGLPMMPGCVSMSTPEVTIFYQLEDGTQISTTLKPRPDAKNPITPSGK